MDWKADLEPLARTVDLNVGESRTVELSDGTEATVRLAGLEETRDDLRSAVRRATVTVEVNGTPVSLVSATYHLPVAVAGVQIDCPVTKGYCSQGANRWALANDARLRLWPAGSPWITPGTFVYPLRQRWFASDTQMANEPVFVDGVERSGPGRIYYHDGLDFGGAERIIDVLAASDGLVVSAGEEGIPGHEDGAGGPKYDTVCLFDRRGWYHRYVHLQSIDPAMAPGQVVRMGQRVGALGKEGSSGGWSHLHFGIRRRQPSGQWGTEEGYAFVWQAYLAQYSPELVAMARPHQLVWTGQEVTLDASSSWSADDLDLRFDWTFTDGTTATGGTVARTYSRAGVYSEILKVTDSRGRTDYDFAVVQVADREQPDRRASGIHAAFAPTFDIGPGDPVTFKVRSFGTTHGQETWDFGDGSAPVSVRSDGNVDRYAEDGYAETVHRFERPGEYIVTARRTNEHGLEAIAHLDVRVGAGQ